MNEIQEFYRNENVIRRMLEYFGVPEKDTENLHLEEGLSSLAESEELKKISEKMTIEFISRWKEDSSKEGDAAYSSRYNWQLGEVLDLGANVFRSIWDKENLTFLIDIEYIRVPAKGKRSPLNFQDCLERTEPTYQCLKEMFAEYGIEPLTLATGRGYHFVFNIPSYLSKDNGRIVTQAAKELTDLGWLDDDLWKKYQDLTFSQKRRRVVEPELGKAYNGMGKLTEFVVHRVADMLQDYGENIIFHIEKPGIADFDLSPYYDPIFTRVSRSAFSVYTKHKDTKIESWDRDFPVVITMPRNMPLMGRELSLSELFEIRKDFKLAAKFAEEIRLSVPKYSEEVSSLVADYKKSDVYEFHEEFMKENDESNEHPALNIEEMPYCLADAIKNPEPKLRHIAIMQNLIRVLRSKGWSVSEITRLTKERYESSDAKEKRNWTKYDSGLCANVITRLYGGLHQLGRDDCADMNCQAQARKDYCLKEDCDFPLEKYV